MALYIIDDHPLMRDALAMLLRRVRPGADVVEMSRLADIEKTVAARGMPELICLDLKLPDTVGTSGVQQLKNLYPQVPLAVISASPAVEAEDLCSQAGADVYIEKSVGAAEITATLRSMLQPEGAEDAGDDGEPPPPEGKLSKRQKQLIVMLDEGLGNREIAERLAISEHTVKVHLWRLFRRLGVKSRTQALHFARTHGLLGN